MERGGGAGEGEEEAEGPDKPVLMKMALKRYIPGKVTLCVKRYLKGAESWRPVFLPANLPEAGQSVLNS